MGVITEQIENEKASTIQELKEKDRTHPCYQVAFRGDAKNVDDDTRKPVQSSKPKTLTPENFEDVEELIKRALRGLEQFRGAPYVMFENKKVWFSAETNGIFPRFEAVTLPSFEVRNRPLLNYAGFEFEGLTFKPMTDIE